MNMFQVKSETDPRPKVLAWHRLDIERRFGVTGGRYTRVNSLLSGIIAAAMTTATYTLLILFADGSSVGAMFVDRGFTPYAMTFLFYWCLTIVFFKTRKLKLQQQALKIPVVPDQADFVLSVATVDQVLQNVTRAVDDPRQFMLFNRIVTSLSNLRNLGRISDLDEMLRSQAELDESSLETSYSLLRGFVWAIPVLGFIGTVMGLSVAIGGFGDVLANTTDPKALADSLRGVTGGLSTAFETTLLALLFALVIQLLVTFLHKQEEEFLDSCTEYCQNQIVSKLRIMPFETEQSV